MNVLGVNCVYHESSAAMAVDGRVVAAAEEERFNRSKHAKLARVDNANELPLASIAYCLQASELRPRDIDGIAFSFDPIKRGDEFRVDPFAREGDWGSSSGEHLFMRSLSTVPARLSTALNIDLNAAVHWVPHHLAHAASAYFPSGVDDASILVVDGIGEHATALMGSAKEGAIEVHDELLFPDSIGFVWEKLSKYLGFSEYDASKVMGLAGYGDPRKYISTLREFADFGDETLQVRADLMQFRSENFSHLEQRLGPRRQRDEPIEQRHADVAAALQHWNDRVMLMLVAKAYRLHPAETLCLAGGVALNCVTNTLVKNDGPFAHTYIPPAPHDSGTAIGAALLVSAQFGGFSQISDPMPTAFLGPSYDDADIELALTKYDVRAHRYADIAMKVADLLASGKIVAWFQGAMEFGPRALGNRSLLADPRDAGTRTRINDVIKHRERFRPFACSILEERVAEWFRIGRQSEGFEYMLYTCPIEPSMAMRVPAVLHVDATSRIHVVARQANPLYHELLVRFEGLTGVPLLLNSSLNDSEPIVCTPSDALMTFMRSSIDALAIGSYLAIR